MNTDIGDKSSVVQFVDRLFLDRFLASFLRYNETYVDTAKYKHDLLSQCYVI
jgi:hypothetical protein